MSVGEADTFFFVSVYVDNEFCLHSLPRCDFIQYAPTYADPGISNGLAFRIMLDYFHLEAVAPSTYKQCACNTCFPTSVLRLFYDISFTLDIWS